MSSQIVDENDEDAIEKLVLTRLMRMNVLTVGIVLGLILGLGLFFATIFLVIKGGEVVGPHLSLLGQYLIGYKVTLGGSFIGLAYGFVIGLAAGSFFSWLYNTVADLRARQTVRGK